MSARKPSKTIGKKDNWTFVRFPTQMLASKVFGSLSPNAHKTLNYLASQYKGKNNGDLQASAKLIQLWGLTSNSMLTKALSELEIKGFVVRTRQGGRNRCSLFALTWFAIDECDGKLDIAATRVALNYWKNKSCAPDTVQCTPDTV